MAQLEKNEVGLGKIERGSGWKKDERKRKKNDRLRWGEFSRLSSGVGVRVHGFGVEAFGPIG
jgi:hypothetical protein